MTVTIHDKHLVKKLEEMKRILSIGWCKASFAQNASGTTCNIYSPDATKFCIIGAMEVAEYDVNVRFELRKALCETIPNAPKKNIENIGVFDSFDMLTLFNDKSCETADDVIKLIEDTIQKLQET